MTEAPEFFVPGCEASEWEDKYTHLAKLCNAAVAPIGKRIYSITYENRGEEWIATVGEQLKGSKPSRRRAKRGEYVPPEPVSDSAVVWAIFEGIPYTVVTNANFEPGVRSQWENPFLAGKPTKIVYFSA